MFRSVKKIALLGTAALLIGLVSVSDAQAQRGRGWGGGGNWGGYRGGYYPGWGYGRGYYGPGVGFSVGRGYPYSGYGYGYPYSSYRYPVYTAPATVVVPSTTYVAPSTTYVAPAAASYTTTAAPASSATIDVRAPAGARVWFGDREAAPSSSSTRRFNSPSLTPGYDYQYHIRAQWMENGQMVQRDRDVTFRAGQHVVIDMMSGG